MIALIMNVFEFLYLCLNNHNLTKLETEKEDILEITEFEVGIAENAKIMIESDTNFQKGIFI